MKEAGAEHVAQWLRTLGVDTKKDDLVATPMRMHTLYAELLDGIGKETKDVWGDILESDQTGLVAVTHIPFVSMCEHHMVPFLGHVDIVYHPAQGRVVGLGKFRRVIAILAHRPQLQERFTRDIADAIENELGVQGVLVRVQAEHMCMTLRADTARGSQVLTTETRGTLGVGGSHREEGYMLLRGVKQ